MDIEVQLRCQGRKKILTRKTKSRKQSAISLGGFLNLVDTFDLKERAQSSQRTGSILEAKDAAICLLFFSNIL